MADRVQNEPCGLQSATIQDGRLELVLNNTLAAIEDGRRRMVEFLSVEPLGEIARHRLEAVFEELVSNIIRHGFARNSRQSIHVRVERQPGLVEFTFEDDGIPFNPLEAKPPEPLKSIETARVGGLGIPLVARSSARLGYERLTPDAGQTDAGQSDAGQSGFSPRNRLVVSIAT
jgi:anti-sigma regulatory factor (Ser/Thr protein kinase)